MISEQQLQTGKPVEESSSEEAVPERSAEQAWLSWRWIAGAFTLALVSLCIARNHRFFHDDAFITLRYAKHLIQGYGPVWNTDGSRVEGFTSVLHLFLVAAVSATHLPMPVAARLVNFTAHLLLIVFVARYLLQHSSRMGAQLGAIVLAASWMFLVWDLGGLDAVLYSALSTAGVLTGLEYFDPAGTRRRRSLIVTSLLLALAVLARPEGGLLLLIFLFLVVVLRSGDEQWRRSFVLAGVLAMMVLLPVELCRWHYFHQIVPNTFYAKVNGIDRLQLVRMGLHYVYRFLIMPPFLGLFALAAAVYAIFQRRFIRVDAALWCFLAASLTYLVVSGGDHMTAFRFALPTLPLFVTSLFVHLNRTGLLEQRRFAIWILAVLAPCLLLQARVSAINPMEMDPAAESGRDVGRYIHTHWPAGSVVALNTAGSTPFYADEMVYIDMLGLNDPVIARRKSIPKDGPWTHLIGHLKGDGSYVLSRRPDYIILGPSRGTTPEHQDSVYFVGDYEIGSSPLFREQYQRCSALTKEQRLFTYYQRRDLNRICPQTSTP